MPVILVRRRSKRSRKESARDRFLVLTGLFMMVLATVAVLLTVPRNRLAPVQIPENAPGTSEPSASDAETNGGRPVFPYSVIQGGVVSADELSKAIAADPVVKYHFSNFDLQKTQVIELEAPKIAHVSYRIGNEIYWTRRRVVLRAGERVLTDGEHMARTRCGNQVSDVPGVTSPFEPDAAVLDLPVLGRKASKIAVPVVAPAGSSQPDTFGGGGIPVGMPVFGGGLGVPSARGSSTPPSLDADFDGRVVSLPSPPSGRLPDPTLPQSGGFSTPPMPGAHSEPPPGFPGLPPGDGLPPLLGLDQLPPGTRGTPANDPIPVPEPGTIGMLIIGVAGLARRFRRRRRTPSANRVK